jgi:hypothetical protein
MSALTTTCLIFLWIASLTGGFYTLLRYDSTSGAQAAAHAIIPPQFSAIDVPNARQTHQFIIFFHPKCSCSMASARELERIVKGISDEVRVTAVFYRPKGVEEDWENTNLRDFVQAIPKVRIVDDPEGTMTEAFGVETSGQVLLYDPQGRLLFEGGITPSRGHEGDSVGKEIILTGLKTQLFEKHSSLVFGCHILDKNVRVNPQEGASL